MQHIKDRVSIEKRPLYINARRQPGHWETDYLLFSRYRQSVLVAQERASRFVLLAKPASRKAAATAASCTDWSAPLPAATAPYPHPRQRHRVRRPHKLRDALGIKTYFCNPHSPWQKGGIENANGRLRRFLPRKTDSAPELATPASTPSLALQQHPAQMPWLQNSRRGILQPPVALQM